VQVLPGDISNYFVPSMAQKTELLIVLGGMQ